MKVSAGSGLLLPEYMCPPRNKRTHDDTLYLASRGTERPLTLNLDRYELQCEMLKINIMSKCLCNFPGLERANSQGAELTKQVICINSGTFEEVFQ